MKFSEKLLYIRKIKGYTQEQLADEMNVSRQAVAKWESGSSYPDILNLVQISNLFHVTLDYLIKDQVCEASAGKASCCSFEELIRFRIEAARNAYAGYADECEPTRIDSHDYEYEKGRFCYHDTYMGGAKFAGEEAIWENGQAVYAMNYMGRVLHETFSGDFLKEALRAASQEMPYRGPEYYQVGEYQYKCRVTGDFAWFQGYEEIFCEKNKVYECWFHGDMISD